MAEILNEEGVNKLLGIQTSQNPLGSGDMLGRIENILGSIERILTNFNLIKDKLGVQKQQAQQQQQIGLTASVPIQQPVQEAKTIIINDDKLKAVLEENLNKIPETFLKMPVEELKKRYETQKFIVQPIILNTIKKIILDVVELK